MKEKKKREFKLWNEFKAFISRGNVVDMAVGVVIGGAFSAIVNALVKIFLSVCTWAVPGGLKGLVTVLPAANSAQAGMDVSLGLGQVFSADSLQQLAENYASSVYGHDVADSVVQQMKTEILSKYTLYGSNYVYNGASTIDWGTFINTIISFLIIALTLFVILKVYNTLQRKRAEVKAKLIEEYYEKNPEARPKPVVEESLLPKPTELDVLLEIKDLLKEKEEKKN